MKNRYRENCIVSLVQFVICVLIYSFILRVTSNHRVRCCRDAAATSRRESQYAEHGSIAVFLRIYNTSAAPPPSAHLPPDTRAPSQTFAPDLSLNRKFLAITGIRRA